MANRRFPRNNNRNYRGNNNSRYKPENTFINCPQCCQQIKVLNDDFQLSLNLHMQSHHGQEMNRQQSRAGVGPNFQRNAPSNYVCPECNENVQVFDNDIKRALEMHARTHQRFGMGTRGDDQSSTSSGRSRNSNRRHNNYAQTVTTSKPVVMSTLDETFYKMQPGLQAHRGFVFENESGEVICGLCQVKIDSVNKIGDHLVTKSHEDSTISFIRSKLPSELPSDTIDFVSFYGSNLCCNLCRCKIDLSSLNLSETIMNIIAHNAGQQHVSKRSRNQPDDRSKDGIRKINFLASKDSLINNNKHVISCEMKPQFKCKLCDKIIPPDQNDQVLIKNFISHFSSNAHNKCVRATSVLTTFKNTYQPKGSNHNLVVTKGSITCTVCNISLDPSLETLDAHVKETENLPNIDWPEDLSARINKMDFKGPQQQPFNMRDENVKTEENKLSKLNILLKCMPQEYRNVDCIVESSHGQLACLKCSRIIPATFYNLKTHLTGSSHMKSTNDELAGGVRTPSDSPTTTPVKSQNFNPFMKETSSPVVSAMGGTDQDMVIPDYLKSSDPLIRQNVTLLTKHNDNVYTCKLCKMTIPNSHDLESFKENLTAHLSGSKHIQAYASKQESELTKLLTVDPLVRANKSCLEMVTKIVTNDKNEYNFEKTLLCSLCNSQLSFSIDGVKLKKTLTKHLTGQQHISKAEETTKQVAPETVAFSSNSMESLKAQYDCSKVSELADNAIKSSNMFKFPVEQLTEPENMINFEESTDGLQKPSILHSNPSSSPSAGESSNKAKTSFNMFPIPTEQLKEPQNSSQLPKESEKQTHANPTTELLATSQFASEAETSSNMFQFPVDQFKGPQNLSKSEESTSRLQKSTFLLPNPTEPLTTSTFANNAKTSSNRFPIPTEQLKTLQNSNKLSEESVIRSTKPSPLLPNYQFPTEPFREQTINTKPKELNSATMKPKLPNPIPNDPIMELFQNLPPSFRSDITYIKNSCIVEGFLSCTICNVDHINPFYLQNHLKEKKHEQGKEAHQPLSAQSDTQSSTSKKVMHQMKNLFGFSK